MGKTRKVPEDLMGTILREVAGPPGGERDSLESVEPGTAPPASGGEGAISWEDQPWLVGTTFNLSKQVGRELDRLRHDLQRQEDIHTSNSEIASWQGDWLADWPARRAWQPGAASTGQDTSSRPPTTKRVR
jgi:hypothetical protein